MEVRTIRPTDIVSIAEVERIAWGGNAASPETIARRAAVFEKGSIVVVKDDEIIGYAASQLTDHLSTECWSVQTDNGMIAKTHVPLGTLAYGVSMSARPGVSGKGVAHHVIRHYADMYLGGGCRALCVGSRVPGYARWAAAQADPSLNGYLFPADGSETRDPELRLYAANGFRLIWELPDYYPDDKSHGHGAMMVRTQKEHPRS